MDNLQGPGKCGRGTERGQRMGAAKKYRLIVDRVSLLPERQKLAKGTDILKEEFRGFPRGKVALTIRF